MPWVVRRCRGKWALLVSKAPSPVWSFLDLYGLQRVGMSKVQYTSIRIVIPKRGIFDDPWKRIPNLCYPVMLIERKIIQQTVNQAKLSDSLRVQEKEYVKPDFIGEF